MRRTTSQSKSASKKLDENLSLRKSKKIASVSQTSGLSSRFTSNNTEPNTKSGRNLMSTGKLDTFKETPSISDMSLEASLTLRDLKNYDIGLDGSN